MKKNRLWQTRTMTVIYRVVIIFLLSLPRDLLAVSELSTKFNIYVPPNNKNNGNAVILTVTAFQNNTLVNILDNGSDGDTDDTYTNILLNEGQTYILYLKEGAVNDDALGKWDGDYFTINANHPVSVMQATTSTYQHDWLPSENKMMRGTKFIFYNPPSGGSPNEINLYSYTDSTDIAIYDITDLPCLVSGVTSVTIQNTPIIKTRLNQGEDLLTIKQIGINQLQAGHTYWVAASKPVTAQFGALFDEVRDGGGFVPSANGSAVGDLFYFAVPGEPDKKEIRILSFENNAEIRLFGWKNGWDLIQIFTLNQLEHGDWVSQNEGYDLFKAISVTGENISIFESNWLETSDEPGTADITTFAASELGHGAGTRFVCYMPPPGDQTNVAGQGTRFTHLFLYGHYPNTNVRIYDTDSQGSKINQTIYLQRDEFHDFKLNTNLYNSIYNGTGNPESGPERPYLTVVSDRRIAVMVTNWHDNWLAYGASVLLPVPKIDYSVNPSFIDRPTQATFGGTLTNFGDTMLDNCTATVTLPDGVQYLSSNWEKSGDVVVTPEPLSGATLLTWSPFEIAIGEEIDFSITVMLSDLNKSRTSGLGNIFTSQIIAGGYSENDFYETSDHAIIFVVKKIPLLPPTTVAAVCNNGSIKLNWSRSPSENIIGYYVYRSLNSSEGFSRAFPAILTDTTFVDQQVVAQNLYYYSIAAVNGALAESEPSLIVSASPNCENPAPEPPVLLIAAPDSARKAIDLRWTIENRAQFAGFWLYRSFTTGSGFSKLRQFSREDTSYADTSVAYNQTVYYVVTAFNGVLTETDFSNELAARIEQRPVPVLLSAVPDSARKSIALTWTITSREPVVAFSLFRRQTSDGKFERIGFLPASDTTFIDLTVQYNQKYYYVVRASYAVGGQSPVSNELTASIFSMPTPVLLQVRPDSATQSIKLVWTIQQRTLIDRFKIYRRLSATGPFEFLSQKLAADTTYTDFQVEFETSYFYVITAFDARHRESYPSNELSGRLSRAVAPEIRLLQVLPDSQTQSMTLVWTALEKDQIARFFIYRGKTSGGPYSKLGQVTAPDSIYLDSAVEFNQLYFYVVTAVDHQNNESPRSNELSGRLIRNSAPELRLLQVIPDSVTQSMTLVWSASEIDQIVRFYIYRGKTSGGPYSKLGQVTAPDSIYLDSAVEFNQLYFYVVTALTKNLQETGYSNEKSGILFYWPTPVLVHAKADSPTVSIELEWQVEPCERITGFIIFRRPEGGDFEVITEVPADKRTFVDTEVTPGVRYYYQIRGFDTHRNLTPLSNILSALLPTPRLREIVFAYPNPCAENICQEIQFRFLLKENAEVTIEIFDLAGDFIHQLTGEGIAGQWNEIPWDVTRIASDVYLFVFRAKNLAKGYDLKVINKIAIVK